ncbi:hypothetical protein ACED51_18525 [Photobacterium swingsii]|uniref:hypothetical protein n=1 Tax=Photobacterium swingsii TaxID=680026 RepID=UPI00352DC8BD
MKPYHKKAILRLLENTNVYKYELLTSISLFLFIHLYVFSFTENIKSPLIIMASAFLGAYLSFRLERNKREHEILTSNNKDFNSFLQLINSKLIVLETIKLEYLMISQPDYYLTELEAAFNVPTYLLDYELISTSTSKIEYLAFTVDEINALEIKNVRNLEYISRVLDGYNKVLKVWKCRNEMLDKFYSSPEIKENKPEYIDELAKLLIDTHGEAEVQKLVNISAQAINLTEQIYNEMYLISNRLPKIYKEFAYREPSLYELIYKKGVKQNLLYFVRTKRKIGEYYPLLKRVKVIHS